MLNGDEELLRKGAVTQIASYEGIGGKLLLTSKRLIFVSHSLNFQSREEAIEIKKITGIASMHSDYLSRRISIYLDDNTVKHFIVYKRKAWVQQICEVARAINHEVKLYSSNNQFLSGAINAKDRTILGALLRGMLAAAIVAALLFVALY